MNFEAIKLDLGADRIKWELTKRSNAGDEFAASALELIEMLEDKNVELQRNLDDCQRYGGY